jgi:ribosomal protein S18 acetylase RimI-like enzyme/ribosomal protein S27AE
MSTQPEIRTADGSDTGRIRELAESSMTTSYALSPQDIDTISKAAFADDNLSDRLEESDTTVFVAEVDDVLAGIVEITVTEDGGRVRRLHVDPERRGGGVGTALFEQAIEDLEDRGVKETRAIALAANTSEGRFFERFGFEKTNERTVEIGGRETIEYVYTESDTTSGEGAESKSDADETDPDYPDSVVTDDETEVYLGEETIQGTEGLFTTSFVDAERSENYGYYCVNCGSTDVSMDDMEQLRCGNCGNTHKPDDEYDGSYL